MTFQLSPEKFSRLEAELIESHQVKLIATAANTGTFATLDGRIVAAFSYSDEAEQLTVTITKHGGYPGFIANSGLNSKLTAAIKALG